MRELSRVNGLVREMRWVRFDVRELEKPRRVKRRLVAGSGVDQSASSIELSYTLVVLFKIKHLRSKQISS